MIYNGVSRIDSVSGYSFYDSMSEEQVHKRLQYQNQKKNLQMLQQISPNVNTKLLDDIYTPGYANPLRKLTFEEYYGANVVYSNLQIYNASVQKFVEDVIPPPHTGKFLRGDRIYMPAISDVATGMTEVRAHLTAEYSATAEVAGYHKEEVNIYTKKGYLQHKEETAFYAKGESKSALITLVHQMKRTGKEISIDNISESGGVYATQRRDANYLVTQHQARHLTKLKDVWSVEPNQFYITDYKDSKGRDIIIYLDDEFDDGVGYKSRHITVFDRDSGRLVDKSPENHNSIYIYRESYMIDVKYFNEDFKAKHGITDEMGKYELKVPEELFEELTKYWLLEDNSGYEEALYKFLDYAVVTDNEEIFDVSVARNEP